MNKQKGLGLYLRILSYLKPYTKRLIGVVACNFGFILFSTLSMWLLAPIITIMFKSTQSIDAGTTLPIVTPETTDVSILNLNEWLKQNIQTLLPQNNPLQTLQWLSIIIFIAFLLKNIFAFIEFYLMTDIEQKVVKDLREESYSKIIYQSLGFFHKHKTGDLISSITNDINSINVAVN